MSMYNLIEYIDNYSDTSGSIWQFKRDESPLNNAGNLDNINATDSSSIIYKSSSEIATGQRYDGTTGFFFFFYDNDIHKTLILNNKN